MSVSIAKNLITFNDLETEVADMKEQSLAKTREQDDNRGRAVDHSQETPDVNKEIENGQTRKFRNRIDALTSKLSALRFSLDKLNTVT